MTHLETQNTSCGQKKGRESIWQFDSGALKVGNFPDLLACRWRATCHWKDFDKGYKFALNLISIGGLHTKLWAPKVGTVARVPTLGISRLPLGSSGTKWHLDVGLVARHIIYYKGQGGGFSQVQAVVSLVSLSLSVARLSTKSAQTLH
jgi:hypothetical protein